MYRSIFIALSLSLLTILTNAQQFDKQAHRGGAGLMPENTIIAAKNAIRLGTTIEMDLYMSKDSQIVVTHDPHIVAAYTQHADGRPVLKEEEKDLQIIEMNYSDIKNIETGLRLYAVFPQQKKVHAYIPLLADLIDSAEAYAKANHFPTPKYNIEPGPAYTITDSFREVFIKKMMAIIISRKIQKRSTIQAFDTGMLEVTHRLYPKMPTVLLLGKDDVQTNLSKLTFKPDIYSPYYKIVTKEMVDECHKLGIKVLPWTVDTKKEIDDLKALGVDGIISNYPDLF
jgi:glycerophosphoryl diester phosphodiesterase